MKNRSGFLRKRFYSRSESPLGSRLLRPLRAGFLKGLRRFRKLLIIFAFVVLLLTGVGGGILYFQSSEVYNYQDSVDWGRLPKVDAIVCLAGGRGRISAAGDVWFRYWEASLSAPGGRIPVLYFSGLGRQSNWLTVSKQFRGGVARVLTSKEVVIENESSNTDANARYLADYARTHAWRRILLLTSSYHMRRARFIFEKVLTQEVGSQQIQVDTLSVYQDPYSVDDWQSDLVGMRVTFLEYIKWIYYTTFWKPQNR